MNRIARAAPVSFVAFTASIALATESTAILDKALAFRGDATVLTDRASDGTLWALGSDWKMRFGGDRTVYYPRVGSRAPRAPALDVTLDSATVGGREVVLDRPLASDLVDGRVSYDRGAIVESWVLAPTSVEQTFVLEAPLGVGDLVLEFGPATELIASGRDAAGLRFEVPAVASIRYGDATVIDAAGRRTSFASEFVAGRLQLRVPAAALEHAAYPVTIDPLIANLSVDVDSQNEIDPDAAYGLSSYLVVYTRMFAAGDRDTVSRRLDDDGDFLDDVAVDISSEDTVDPAVAAANSNFMIVWNQLADGSLFSDNVIRGRRRIETTGVQAAAFDISTGAKNERDPDVGGTDHLVARPFFVVWSEDPLIGGVETHGRAIDQLGNDLGSDVFFGLGDANNGPRISKSAGAAGRYLVVFESIGTTHRFLDAQMVSEAGAKVGNLVVVNQNLNTDPIVADVDGDGTNWMATYQIKLGSGDFDIEGSVLTATGPSTLTMLGQLNLSHIALSSSESSTQDRPAVASEGCRFTFAFRDGPVGAQHVVVESIVTSGTSPLQFTTVDEGAVHGNDGNAKGDMCLVATRFQEIGTTLLAFQSGVPNNNDILGVLRNNLKAGGTTTVQTGCGTTEPAILASPSAGVGTPFSLLIFNNVSPAPLMAIGTPLANPIPLCSGQAPGCLLGVNALTVSALPSIINAPIPCSPALVGFTAAVQLIDTLPANATGVLCGPPKYTQKFRVSDTVHIKFQ